MILKDTIFSTNSAALIRKTVLRYKEKILGDRFSLIPGFGLWLIHVRILLSFFLLNCVLKRVIGRNYATLILRRLFRQIFWLNRGVLGRVDFVYKTKVLETP
jgi:hypothetical protein